MRQGLHIGINIVGYIDTLIFNRIHISIIILALTFGKASGQTVPWTVTPTTEEYHVIIPDTTSFVITGFNLEIGDYIAVQYDSASAKMKVGGMMQWNGTTDTITAYGDTGFEDGFKDSEIFEFVIWDASEDCIVRALTPTYQGGLEASFIDGGSTYLDALIGTANNLFYAHDYFCQNYSLGGVNPQAFQTGLFLGDTISFSSQLGLDLDTVSGEISTHTSMPGSYYVSFHVTESCMIDDSVQITIAESFNDALDSNLKQKIECDHSSVDFTLDSSYFSNGLPLYQIDIYSIVDNVLLNANTPSAMNLVEGNYEITITDGLGCVDTLSLAIVENDNCDNPVLTPELNDEYSTYTIDCSELIKIYNRYGQLIRKDQGPLVWDGSDNSGQLVVTGDYFIFCDDKKIETITVIR